MGASSAAVRLERDRDRLPGRDLPRAAAPTPGSLEEPGRLRRRRPRRPRSRSPCPPAPAASVRTTSAASPLGVTTRLGLAARRSRQLRAFGSPSTAQLAARRRRGRSRARSPRAEPDRGDRRDGRDRRTSAGTREAARAAARRSTARCAPARGSGSRSDAGGSRAAGRVARARRRPARSPASSSRQRSHEERCSSKVLALGRVERVERVARGQLVNVHEFLSAPSSSSSRSRDRPENILLLIVPSGWPSRSASSDWV